MVFVAIPVVVEGWTNLYRFEECETEEDVLRAIQGSYYGDDVIILKRVRLTVGIEDDE